MSRVRCINLDWFEVHCLESNDLFPVDASFLRSKGWHVEQRDYGTRVYNEMFTVFDTNEMPFLEIRRSPKSDSNLQGILDPRSCHIRLVNRYCYFSNCVQLLREFLSRYNYEFRRIFRADICLDFERFDLGDDPAKFIQRYMRHKYAKINQCRRRTSGEDRWDGCIDNYISWGNPKSLVSTKLYDKTKELREVHDKPYIRQAWFAAGLITNPLTCVKVRPDGTQYKPTIWRVEFSVHSGTAGWLVLDDNTGNKTRKKPIANNLSMYDTGDKLITLFATLAHHYFHFKVYEKDKRKDRCKDKVLFTWKLGEDCRYKLQRVASDRPANNDDMQLRRKLEKYRELHFDPAIRKACDCILDNISRDDLRRLTETGWDIAQLLELQTLLRERLAQPEEDFQVTLNRVRELLNRSESWF